MVRRRRGAARRHLRRAHLPATRPGALAARQPAGVVLFAAAYRAGRVTPGGWWRRVGSPMLAFAACVLAKASGLAFAPLVMVAVEGEMWLKPHGGKARGSPWENEPRALPPWG